MASSKCGTRSTAIQLLYLGACSRQLLFYSPRMSMTFGFICLSKVRLLLLLLCLAANWLCILRSAPLATGSSRVWRLSSSSSSGRLLARVSWLSAGDEGSLGVRARSPLFPALLSVCLQLIGILSSPCADRTVRACQTVQLSFGHSPV